MKKMLEFIRAVLVVTAVPAVVMFYLSSSRTWLYMLVYVVSATLVLLVLNHLLKEDPEGDVKTPPSQPPK